MIRFLAIIWSSLFLAAWAQAYPIDLVIAEGADDGVELDHRTWQEDTSPLVMGRPGDGESRSVGLRFLATPLQVTRHVEFARLRFSIKGGAIQDSLGIRIRGVLDQAGLPFSQDRRPSQLPATQANSRLHFHEVWGDGGPNQLFYYSGDLSDIVNEIVQQPGWGDEGDGLLLCLEDESSLRLATNYLEFSDWQPLRWPATLQVCRTLEETFLAKEIVGRPTASSATVNFASLVSMQAFVEYGTSGFDQATDPVVVPASVPMDIELTGLPADTSCRYRLRYRRAGADEDFRTGQTRHFRTQRAPGDSFVFTVQADSHIWESWAKADPDDDEMKLYVRTIDNATYDGPDLHFSMGDFSMTEYSQDRQHAQDRYLVQRPFLDRMLHSVPMYLVIGNHEGELGYFHVQDDPMPAWAEQARRDLIPNPFPDGFYSGCPEPSTDGQGHRESYFSFEWGDALLVVLDPYWYTLERPFHNEVPAEGGGWAWTLGRDQYDWLHEVISTSDRRWKVIFLHHLVGGVDNGNSAYGRGGVETVKHAVAGRPSFEWGGEGASGFNEFANRRPDFEHGPIHDMLVENGVSVVVKGHDHFYGRQELDGLTYLTVPQPMDRLYQFGGMEPGEYEHGVLLPNAGHVRFEVSPQNLRLEYVRSFLPGEGVNGEVADSHTLGDHLAAAPLPTASTRLLITPNPAGARVKIQPQLADPLASADAGEVSIYDVGGRLVRRLRATEEGAFLWNRDDRRGQPVPTGLYFATWRGEGQNITGRVTVIR